MPAPAPWSPTFNFNFRNAAAQTQIKFVQLSNGDFWVVWTDSEDSGAGAPAGTDLVGQRYNLLGEPQGGEVRLNSGLFLTDERNAALAADVGSSEFFIAYERMNADGSIDLRLERKNADGSAVAFVIVATDTDGAAGLGFRNPQIAIASASSGLIVFERTNSAGTTDIVGLRFDPSTGGLVGNFFLIGDLPTDALNPALTVTSDGRYAVSYSGGGNLNLRFINQDATMSIALTPVIGGNIVDPSIAPLGNGQVAISYTTNSGTIGLAVVSSSGNILANDFSISATGASDSHVVGIDGDTVVVAWDRGAGSIATATYDYASNSLTDAGTSFFGPAGSVSDIALLAMADGRILIGYDGPTGQAQIRDPRSSVNMTPVYDPTAWQIGTPGDDVIVANIDADVVHGGNGDDFIGDGDGTQQLLAGGNGNDTIVFAQVDAAESGDGGPGNDTLEYITLSGPTTVNLGAGTAIAGGVTQIVARFENFRTSVGVDITVTAGAAFANLTTGAGNDTLDLGAGGGVMTGGNGNDTYIVNGAGDAVVESPNQGVDTIVTTLATYSLGPNLENLVYTGSAAATLRGNSLNNSISGGAQSNLILLQDFGSDNAIGGGGNDGFYFGAAFDATDTVNGGAGTMDQIGLQGNYSAGLTLNANATVGVEFIVLLAGNDTRFGGQTGTNLSYNLTTRDANIASGQRLTFQANALRAGENFTLNASAETDGSILTFGGLGTDTIIGGQSVDGFYFGTGRFNAGDTVNGGGGVDQIGFQGDYSGANGLFFGAGQISNIEGMVFMSASDTRFGGGNVGQSFTYNVVMNDGNTATGQEMLIQANTLMTSEGLTFNGSAELGGVFRVFGGAANDVLIGGQGGDDITGGGGNDRITGSRGQDILRGGLGSDRFIYNEINESTAVLYDRILDFNVGDSIQFTNLDANSLVAGRQGFSLIASGQAFTAAGQLRITQTGNIALVEGDSNGDGNVDFKIEVTLTGGHILGASDFVDLAPAAEVLKPLETETPADIPAWRVRPDFHLETDTPLTSDLVI